MRQTSHDDVAEAARRRLELVRRELAAAGYEPRDDRPGPEDSGSFFDTLESADPTEPPVLLDPGRHARRTIGLRERLGRVAGEALPDTMRGRVSLSPPHVTVVALVAALALTVAAVIALRSGGESTAVPPRPVLASTVPDEGSDEGGAGGDGTGPLAAAQEPAGASSPTGGSDTVVIDVAGKVRRPGVFTLPAGSRVIDAIKRAGGLTGKPSLAGLNRARVLVDGEQVLVGVQAAAGVAASSATSPGAAAPGDLVSLNSATQAQLEELPGVGPVTAEKIVAWRQSHGAFSAIDELLEVDGIGDKTLAELAPHLTL